MLARIKLLCLLVVVADLILLGVMVHYTSWLFMLAFVFISGLFGGWMLNDGLRRYVRKSGKEMNANRMPADGLLLGVAARLAAGALLMVPGVLTDFMALLLLSPAGKRLARSFIAALFTEMFPRLSNREFDFRTSGETPAKDEIIDVRIVNPGEKEPEKGP